MTNRALAAVGESDLQGCKAPWVGSDIAKVTPLT